MAGAMSFAICGRKTKHMENVIMMVTCGGTSAMVVATACAQV